MNRLCAGAAAAAKYSVCTSYVRADVGISPCNSKRNPSSTCVGGAMPTSPRERRNSSYIGFGRRATPAQKTLVVQKLRQKYSLKLLLSIAQLPRASFYYHLKQMQKEDKYASVKEEITVGKIAPNLLNRDFHAEKPNQKWVTDQTGTDRISGLLQQPQDQGKAKGLAACNSQTASPFGCLNNLYFKILSNFWGSLHSVRAAFCENVRPRYFVNFSQKRSRCAGKQMIIAATAPTPACRNWKGSFRMAYSGVL